MLMILPARASLVADKRHRPRTSSPIPKFI